MVFGLGRKRGREEIAPAADPEERGIRLDEVQGALDSMVSLRQKTLVSETAALRSRMAPGFEELGRIAGSLAKDTLKADEMDRHVSIIVERGKSVVTDTFRAETASPLPDVSDMESAAGFRADSERRIRRMGDAVGRHTRVLHLFAKKYANRIKAILKDLESSRKASSDIAKAYEDVAASAERVLSDIAKLGSLEDEARAKSGQADEYDKSSASAGASAERISSEIDAMQKSSQYAEHCSLKSDLERLDSEAARLRQRINDSFVRASRPLSKYQYVTSLERSQKELLALLVNDPYGALDPGKAPEIALILESARKAVSAGSVSVKDPSKASDAIGAIIDSLQSMTAEKSAQLAKAKGVSEKMASCFDVPALERLCAERDAEAARQAEHSRRAKRLRQESAESAQAASDMLGAVQAGLRRATSVSYTIAR